jgi:hypothetical protein
MVLPEVPAVSQVVEVEVEMAVRDQHNANDPSRRSCATEHAEASGIA